MKKIISDSLWAHMFMFFLLIHFMIMWLAVGMLHPVLFVIVGSIYVLNIINSAINIADFEMSIQGSIAKQLNDCGDLRNVRDVKIILSE